MNTDIPARPFWADPKLCNYPKRWQAQMVEEWREFAATSRGGADAWLKRRIGELETANLAGLNPGMDDAAICSLAESEAKDYRNHFATLEGKLRQSWGHLSPSCFRTYATRRKLSLARRLMGFRGMADLWPDSPLMTEAGRLERLGAPEFWRRAFRKAHARTVEQCAIALGFVKADKDVYISRESRNLYAARKSANEFMLANTVAVNENGDEKTLLELAAQSVANPAIRRGELMTRVSGFEACADALGHVKRWAVLTCPSRMHKWVKLDNGKTVHNKKYDGTKPKDAHMYLADQWRKVCAWWARQGLRVYGFRTTEPHHDGCPHWNLLAFFAPMTERIYLQKQCKIPVDAIGVFDEGLREYFLLNDSADEAGAEKHRIRIEAIDPSKGSAASYIAKYISKGLDGHGIETDLLGHPMENTAPAIVAWARVWGIRQFQQVGGPPVTVWRELRRLNPENTDKAPAAIVDAMNAANIKHTEPEQKRAVGWARYTTTQGGPTCKRRDWKVRLLRADREGVNRYGEPQTARVIGLQTEGREAVPAPAHMAHLKTAGFSRAVWFGIEAERGDWVVVPKRSVDDAINEQCERMAAKLREFDRNDAQRIQLAQQRREVVSVLGEARRPWTRVNNCTAANLSFTPTLDSIDRKEPRNPFAPAKIYRGKLGRFHQWTQSGGAGGPNRGVSVES